MALVILTVIHLDAQAQNMKRHLWEDIIAPTQQQAVEIRRARLR